VADPPLLAINEICALVDGLLELTAAITGAFGA